MELGIWTLNFLLLLNITFYFLYLQYENKMIFTLLQFSKR